MASVEVSVEEGISVIAVPQRVDVSNVRALVEPARIAVEEGQRRVILDFASTEMIDSTALGAIVQLYKLLEQKGGVLVLAGVGDAVTRLFAITRLNRVFRTAGSRQQAVAELRGTPSYE